jgi:UMF1 family MFS transporter
MPLPKRPASGRDASMSNTSSVSNEADDERSWASPPTMAQRGARHGPQYEGEDTRPTSSKELRGFYAYSWASEVFVICGMGRFPASADSWNMC